MAESSGNDDIKDLIGFLTNEKLMLRKMAAEAVAGLTGSPAASIPAQDVASQDVAYISVVM